MPTALKLLLKKEKERLFESFTVNQYLWGYNERTIQYVNDLIAKIGIKYKFPEVVGLFTGVSFCTSGLGPT